MFVKNLENIQGDERDVIIFSICYGPDSLGRIAMNFGPMNREGGERRLNVAITRAKRELLVFSTLSADQIDLARTRARGVRDLKNFLAYAERGPSAISQEIQYNTEADFDSPFEKEVHDVLVENGWEIHLQVGCARYRIDLAVVDPEAPGRYLLGIECDGANYHSTKTARDRDIIREGVLRDLGWELYRIWSTDWWSNPEQEAQKLEAALVEVQTAPRKSYLGIESAAVTGGSTKRVENESIAQIGESTSIHEPSIPKRVQFPIYSPYSIGEIVGTQQDFYEPLSSTAIRALIEDVVDLEGPISLRLMARRVAAHWGLHRISSKALDRVSELLPRSNVQVDSLAGGTFLWPIGVDPDSYQGFRVSDTNADTNRDPLDLPLQEVANAVVFLLESQISAPEVEVVREASRLFGFRKTGKLVDDRMRAGIAYSVQKGTVKREGDSLTL